MNNGRQYHLAAILRRNGKVVKVGENTSKTHPKFKRKYSKDGEANPYAIKSRPGSTEVSLLTHDEEEESFKPTDAGMAAALGFIV